MSSNLYDYVMQIEGLSNPLPVSLSSVPLHSVSVTNFPSSYPVTGTFWPTTQPVSISTMPSTPVTGTFWQSNQPVTVSNPVVTSNISVVTSTNVLLVSIQIAPANPNRKAFIIFNNSANSTYVTLGPTSVAANCTRLIATFTSWEVTSGLIWTGPISAIRNAGSGQTTVYEFQ